MISNTNFEGTKKTSRVFWGAYRNIADNVCVQRIEDRSIYSPVRRRDSVVHVCFAVCIHHGRLFQGVTRPLCQILSSPWRVHIGIGLVDRRSDLTNASTTIEMCLNLLWILHQPLGLRASIKRLHTIHSEHHSKNKSHQ